MGESKGWEASVCSVRAGGFRVSCAEQQRPECACLTRTSALLELLWNKLRVLFRASKVNLFVHLVLAPEVEKTEDREQEAFILRPQCQ